MMNSVEELDVKEVKEGGEPNSTVDSFRKDKAECWTQESLARLVGFEEESSPLTPEELPPPFSSETQSNFDAQSPGSGDGNVLSESELFDAQQEPKDDSLPLKRFLSGNPLMKLLVVAGGLSVAFLGAGLFVSQIMDSSPTKEKPQLVSTPTPTPTVTPEKEKNTEGQLKTELALSKQSDQLQKVDEASRQKQKEMKDKNKKNKEKPGSEKSKPPQNVASATPSPAVSASPRTSSVSRPTSSFTPRSTTAFSPPPPQQPRQLASPTPSTPLRQIASTPTPTPSTPPASSTPKPVARNSSPPQDASSPADSEAGRDSVLPLQQWQTLAQLGSYGQVMAVTADEPDMARSELTRSQRRNSNMREGQNNSPPTPTSSNDSAIETEESRLLEGKPYTLARVGDSTTGVLVSPIIWSGKGTEDQRFVVALDKPLLSESGSEVLPAGTSLVFSMTGVQDNGLVTAKVVSAIIGQTEYLLPEGSLTLMSEDSGPLIARGYFDNGGTIASMDISTAILGALGKVGEILNEPTSEVSSIVSNGTTSTSTSSTTRNPNLLGALLEGGAKPVLDPTFRTHNCHKDG